MANRNIEHAVRLALLAGAATAGVYAPASFAQDQEVEQIIVTGSRIPQPNIEGTSPVTTLGSAEIKLEGTQQVNQLINTLPQAFADQSGTLANGASGTATINLRNLGAQRTLVLVNGRRMPAGSPQYIAPDVNQIPASLIKRVEVLTGGASAVYGSDAVAGVVNFIMNDSFEGVQFDFNGSAYWHNNNNNYMRDMLKGANDGSGNKNGWIFQVFPPGASPYLPYGIPTPPSPHSVFDGEDYNFGITLGSNFADGKGNASLYFGYDHTDPVLQSQRDYSNCSILETTTSTFGGNASGQYCGGSTTTYPGRFRVVKQPQAARNTLSYWNHGLDTTTGLPTGTFNSSGAFPFFNYGPYNYYQRPNERWQADAFLKYDVSDKMQAYAQFMFMDNTTHAQIAPSGAFGVPTTINCDDNPYLNQVGWKDIVCYDYNAADGTSTYTPTRGMIFNRRNVEGAPRVDNLELTSYQGVIGVRGQWLDHWDYDVSAQYGKVVYNENYSNDASVTRIQRALDVVDGDPINHPGDPAYAVCRSVVDGTDPACVPWNIWIVNPATGVLGPSAGAAYIVAPGFSSGNTEQTVVTATTTSNLGDYGIMMPWAKDGIGLALGTEYRQEGLVYSPDAEFQTGDLSGQGGPQLPVHGSYNVVDLFGEARVPIVQDASFAKDITMNGSYRYSSYSEGFDTNTYGIGLDWQIIDDVKLRGSFQHAVRAPNIIELYTPASLGLFNWLAGDPCSDSQSFTVGQCVVTGLNPALVGSPDLRNPAQQYNAFYGGNQNLKPEKADTWTTGIVFTPTFLEGFSLTVDYFNIKIDDTIGTVPPALTMQLCGESLDPTNVYCQAIHRDATGSVWALPQGYIDAIITNTGTTKTSGVDVNADYLVHMGDWGSLDFTLIGTYLDNFEVQPISGVDIKYDCKGYYGSTWCFTPYPEWKHKFRTTWSTPWNVDLSLNWRYIASVKDETCSSNPLLGVVNPRTGLSLCFPDQKTLDAQNYFDLAMVYTFGEHYTMTAGINNLTDEEPPLTSDQGAPYGNGNTFPAVYDALGRYVFVGLTAKF
jgi:iron complex outermembrane recepter protein